MKFIKDLNIGLTYIIGSLIMFSALLFCSIVSNHIIVWIFTGILFIFTIISSFVFMTSFVKIDEEGISFYRFSKLNKLYKWDEIRCYEDSSSGRFSIILFTLKNDESFHVDNRKKINNEIIKYCGCIPDFSDIGKINNIERYSNYKEKFIDLSECEFETVHCPDEYCVFCNKKMKTVSESCYHTQKGKRNFYICPTCFNDFKKYYRFKIKKSN